MPSGWRAMTEFTNGCGEMVEALEFTAMERATELRGGNWKIWMWNSEFHLPLQANETWRQESLHSFFPLLQIPWKPGSSLTTNKRGGRFIQIHACQLNVNQGFNLAMYQHSRSNTKWIDHRYSQTLLKSQEIHLSQQLRPQRQLGPRQRRQGPLLDFGTEPFGAWECSSCSPKNETKTN